MLNFEMLEHYYPIFLALLLIHSAWFLIRRIFSPRLVLPPSPPKIPIIGNIHQLVGMHHHSAITALSKKYGPLMFLQVGQEKVFVVTSPAITKELVKSYDIPIANRPQALSIKRLSYNCKGLISAPYGEQWKKLRVIYMNNLLHVNRTKSLKSIRDEETANLVKKIQESSATSAPINLSHMFFMLTNGLICRTAFGKIYAEGREELKNKLVELVHRGDKYIFKVTLGDLIPWLGWIVDWLNGYRAELERFCKFQDDVYEEILGEYEAYRHGKSGEDWNRDLFIEILHRLNVEEGMIDRDTIKAIFMDIIGAGTHTSGTALSCAMTELLRHPGSMKKLQNEVRGIMNGKQHITNADLDKMLYLKVVVKETLRLYPPIPVITRRTNEDIKVMGYDIPSRSTIWVNLWGISRDPTCWDEPDKFMPERFLKASLDDFQHIPFGIGRRICPGMSLANTLIEYVLANLMHKFNWQLPNGERVEDLDVTVRLDDGVLVKKNPLMVVATNCDV